MNGRILVGDHVEIEEKIVGEDEKKDQITG